MAHLLAPVVELDQDPACPAKTLYVSPAAPQGMLRSAPWCVDDYDLLKQLYRGKASLLYRATCRHSNQPVALKLYRKHKLSTLNWYQVAREIQIHSALVHDHIIALYGAFEDGKHVYLVQEFAPGGDLYEELKRVGGRFRERDTAARVLGPCLQALAHCQSAGVIHRDIKPENILLGRRREVKLADFGLSINATLERPVTRAGTLDYMAPEVLVCPEKCRPEDNKNKISLVYGRTIDAWGMGVLAYELIVGRPPFEKETRAATYECIMYRKPPYPSWLSDAARSFIDTALHKESRQRPDVLDLLLHPFITAVRPSIKVPTTDLQTYPPAMPAFKAHMPKQALPPGVIVSSFAIEAAKRQEEAQSSFQGAAMNPGMGSHSALNKRSLPVLQKTESVPDIVMAAAQAAGEAAPQPVAPLQLADSLPIYKRMDTQLSTGLPQPQPAPSDAKSDWPEVLQLHADSTSASVSWADYSHGALSGSAAPPHSPVCGQQGPEFGDGDAADSPGSMSAMLTWAGAGMKQLASKLLGSSSLTDSQQGADGTTDSNIEGTAPYQLPDMSLTLSGSDHSATLQALSAASSHSNNLDRLGSSRQGSMQPADTDGITSSQELQHSGELARDGSAAVRTGPAGPAPGATLPHGMTPEPQVKRKRFNGIRRALKASRPATALAPPSAFGSGGSGVAPPAATLPRPASSSGPRARDDQAPATNLGTWPATSTSHTHHRYTAAQPKPGRVSVTRQPQLPPTGHPAAAAAAPKPAFQRSASRSLGPAVAAGQAAKSAAARLAAEPAVERSAASLPSAKGGWGAAVSPFAALLLGPSEAANNAVGMLAVPPGDAGGSLRTSSAVVVPALYGAAARGGGDEQLNSLRTRSVKDAAATVAAASPGVGGDPALTLLDTTQEETTSAAEVLELLHHADSCNLDQLPPEGPTFTGEQSPLLSPLLSPAVLSPKPSALGLASAQPLQGGLKVAQRTGDSAAADPEAIALLHQKSSMGAATVEEAWTIHTLGGSADEGRNNMAV